MTIEKVDSISKERIQNVTDTSKATPAKGLTKESAVEVDQWNEGGTLVLG